MINFETIDLLRLSMNMSTLENKLAAKNIANSHNSSGTLYADFSNMLSEISVVNATKTDSLNTLSHKINTQSDDYVQHSITQKSPDNYVADSLKSAGEFNRAADLLNRQLGLMRLAVKGGR